MEPTKPASEYPYNYAVSNPYKDTVKSDIYGIPILPPPPPVKRNWWKTVAIIEATIILCISLFFSYSIIVQKVSGSDKINKAVSASTRQSMVLTSTSQPIASYTALTLLKMFIANVNHTGASSAKVNDNWQCCTYVPTRGAYVWCDSCSDGPGAAYYVDIAVFSSDLQAVTDENELLNKGYGTNVVNNCLLSYDVELSGSYVTEQYIQIMRYVCTN